MITRLEWDSNFFGHNIASLSLSNEKDLENMYQFIQMYELDFIQTLCKVDEVNKIRILENNNFHFADIKITFTLDMRKLVQPEKVIFDVAKPSDKEVISNLASNSFIDSRYYGHEHVFSKDKVSEMFRIWAEKSITGQFDDFCLKVLSGNELCGFITTKIQDANIATIGILAVDEKFRGKGVGLSLLQSLFSFLREKDIFEVEVSTQGKNIIAQNLYTKAGFRVKRLESWYYCYTSNTNLKD